MHCGERQALSVTFDVAYRNANMIRAMFVDRQTKSALHCETDTQITFAVRHDAEAYLADERIACDGDASVLSGGMRVLYGVSAPIELKQGRYALCSGKDLKYLPSVLMIGNFSAEVVSGERCSVILRERRERLRAGERFSDFGEIALTAKVTVPPTARALELKGTTLYTRLYLDGKLIGERIGAPYIFAIDEAMRRRTVELTLVQSSSQAPIFGDVGYFDRMSENVKWRGTAVPSQTLFGVPEINWIV